LSPTPANNGLKLDRRIAAFDAELVQWAKENEEARRTTIPGFGAIVASALVAQGLSKCRGHAESFNRGRDMAAWLGLVPRQFTTGGKPKLLLDQQAGQQIFARST
jgi:transposase